MTQVYQAIVESATGRVVLEWQKPDNPDDRTLVAKSGFIVIDCLPHLPGPFTPKQWTGRGFVPKIVRIVSWRAFMNRWTIDEQDALEKMADTRPTLRSWQARMMRENKVKLDSSELIRILAFVKSQGMWIDDATADTRITAMRADG